MDFSGVSVNKYKTKELSLYAFAVGLDTSLFTKQSVAYVYMLNIGTLMM